MRQEILYDELYDVHAHYRLLWDSIARPGKISTFPCDELMPPAGLQKASARIALTLLNADVTFSYIGINPVEVSNYILFNTSSMRRAPEKADFVFMNGLRSGDEVPGISTGTLTYPAEGATIIIDVRSIRASACRGYKQLTLVDYRAEVQHTLYVAGLNTCILEKLSVWNQGFPLGIDLILTDGDSNICCIPRHNRFTWK